MNNRILITGVAGFIGYHVAQRRLALGDEVVGIDNLNGYYDVRLKLSRLDLLKSHPKFNFYSGDIVDGDQLTQVFTAHQPQRVVHLAAQAGVRYSLESPQAFVKSNLVGFSQVLEACRHHAIEHLVYASSSSVYGANTSLPYLTSAATNHPLSMYAATKKANELMAHSYSHLFQLPTTGLRFFTVYGPWGRPDMAFFSFTRDILAGVPINIFNHGRMQRDFTYIDDLVTGISLVLDTPATANPDWCSDHPNPDSSTAPYRLYNIGGGEPVALLDYIAAIERATGKQAIKRFLPLQAGDVVSTHADTRAFQQAFGFVPRWSVDDGVEAFVRWYRDYFNE